MIISLPVDAFFCYYTNQTVMKKILWLAPLLFFCSLLSAQTSTPGFVIINPRSVPNLSDYVYALNHNDLDRFRHMDHRTTIHFTAGVDVQLLSGTEMVNAGLPLDLSKVNTTSLDRARNSQFSLHPSGRIIIKANTLKKGL